MKITYKFVDDTKSEVEVSDEIGAIIIDSRREEESAERRHRRHSYSMDAAVYEGLEYGVEDFTHALFDDTDERNERVRTAFAHLSDTQQKRLLLLAGGLSVREIARREGKNYRSVYESIEAAKKKFQKNF